ncbi:MAG: hypothetical protein LBV23_06515 [Deltaproteobacteria bacterium]|jgi:hypothetical protein|nr:hypothetical protein [Deltaproteobacteria bacterium]
MTLLGDTENQLAQAFHQMFDNFPEWAQLTHKSFRVVAVNPAMKALGRKEGLSCNEGGEPMGHSGCWAQTALASGKPVWAKQPLSLPDSLGGVVFWIPIEGHPDYFVHFTIGQRFDYNRPPDFGPCPTVEI